MTDPIMNPEALTRVAFRVAMRGYDMAQVDDFIDQVIDNINAQRPPLPSILPVFKPSFRGYAYDDVDAFMARLAGQGQGPAPANPAADPTRPGSEQLPSAIDERRKRGWFGRR